MRFKIFVERHDHTLDTYPIALVQRRYISTPRFHLDQAQHPAEILAVISNRYAVCLSLREVRLPKVITNRRSASDLPLKVVHDLLALLLKDIPRQLQRGLSLQISVELFVYAGLHKRFFLGMQLMGYRKHNNSSQERARDQPIMGSWLHL